MRLILMGVSGSGKTTIGCHLSHASGKKYCHFKKRHFAIQWNPLGVPPGLLSSHLDAYSDEQVSSGLKFFDADDFHPQKNVAKMAAGEPLTDEDRYWTTSRLFPSFRLPWLKTLASLLVDHPDCILACSALKQRYRELLLENLPSAEVTFIYLRLKLNCPTV